VVGLKILVAFVIFDTFFRFIKFINNFNNIIILGVTPSANTTMFIKYRVGGGSVSNVGSNVLLIGYYMNVDGPDATLNSAGSNIFKVNITFQL
jgi:hypothetical protein